MTRTTRMTIGFCLALSLLILSVTVAAFAQQKEPITVYMMLPAEIEPSPDHVAMITGKLSNGITLTNNTINCGSTRDEFGLTKPDPIFQDAAAYGRELLLVDSTTGKRSLVTGYFIGAAPRAGTKLVDFVCLDNCRTCLDYINGAETFFKKYKVTAHR